MFAPVPTSKVATVPKLRFVRAVPALFRSLKLLAIASFVASVPVTLVNCEPSTAGKPVASRTTTFPFDVPVSSVATVPKLRFVLAVAALFKSLKLFAIASFVASVAVMFVNCEPSTAGNREDQSS